MPNFVPTWAIIPSLINLDHLENLVNLENLAPLENLVNLENLAPLETLNNNPKQQ